MSALRNDQIITPPTSPEESELARTSSRLLAACIGHGNIAQGNDSELVDKYPFREKFYARSVPFAQSFGLHCCIGRIGSSV